MKLILVVATKCQIITLKCTKFDWAPDPGEGACSWSPSWCRWGLAAHSLIGATELTMSRSSKIRSYIHCTSHKCVRSSAELEPLRSFVFTLYSAARAARPLAGL